MHIIRLPEPCREDWHQMTPVAQGRHCQVCCKTVVDFTGWEPAEILGYLRENTGTCGRFRPAQLDRPIPESDVFIAAVSRSPLSFAGRIAALVVFVFVLMTSACSSPERGDAPLRTPAPQVRAGAGLPAQDTALPPAPPDSFLEGEPVVAPAPPEVTGEPVMVPEPVLPIGGVPELEPLTLSGTPGIAPVMAPPQEDSTGPMSLPPPDDSL